ncbi:MAG: hypothetical protein JO332_05590, partial [Planctomycetaceae bacterium]|nr:hypothetical protein [Planctomycetaceae bacterium]
ALILGAIPAPADDKETLQQAVARLAEIDSYSFKGETEFQSQFGNAPPTIPTLDGKYQKDAGLYIKSDKGELFRKGDRVLVKQGQGDWQDSSQFQPPTPPAGANRPRAGGLFGKMMLRNVKAPHEELKDTVKGLKTVRKDEKTEKIGDIDCTQYSGDLSDEAMKGSPLGRILTTFGGANASVNGNARFWVDTHGNLVIYEIVTKATVEFQGNQIDFSLTRRSELSDLGKTKVEVPEAVQKLLAEKAKPEKSEDKKDQ